MRFGKLIRKLQFLRRILASDRMREMVYEEECIKHEGRTNYYSRLARERAVECGEHLKVNNPCVFTGKVHFANNCNFNGMSVIGNGEVFLATTFILERVVKLLRKIIIMKAIASPMTPR